MYGGNPDLYQCSFCLGIFEGSSWELKSLGWQLCYECNAKLCQDVIEDLYMDYAESFEELDELDREKCDWCGKLVISSELEDYMIVDGIWGKSCRDHIYPDPERV